MKRYTVAALLSAIAAPSLAQESGSTASYSSTGSSHAAVQSIVPVPETYHHALTVPGIGDTISSFDPELYIDSVLGVQTSGTNATANPHAAHQQYIREDLRRQLNLRKQEMMNDYAREMFELQLELQEIALQLQYCNWNCVSQCSTHALDIRSKTACVDTCGCYQSELAQQQPTQQNPYAQQPIALFSQAATTTQTTNEPQANGAATTATAAPMLTPEQQFQLAESQLQTQQSAYEMTLEQQQVQAELLLEQKIQAEEMRRQQALQAQNLQFEAAMVALNNEQLALEQAMAYQQQQLQLGVYPTTASTATTQSIVDMVNQQRAQQMAIDAKRLDLERQHQLAILQAEAEQRQFELAIHEQRLSQEFAFDEQMANLEFQAELQQQNLVEQQQAAYTANLPPQFQDLLAQQNQAARDQILRDRLNAKVELSLDRVLESRTANHAQFKAVLDSAAKSLGCDPLCVDQCSAFRLTMEEQANCLDICLCYASPQERALLQGSLGYTATYGAQTQGSTTAAADASAQASVEASASTGSSTTVTTTTASMSGSHTVESGATLSLGQLPQAYDTVSTMALFAGILILGMVAFHYMKKEKKTDKEASPFEETAYSLLQA